MSADVTLFVLVACLCLQVLKYRSKVLLHPSSFFFMVWILSLISFKIHLSIGFDYFLIDEKALEELFLFVCFTSLCFAAFGLRNVRLVRFGRIMPSLYINRSFFFYYSWILFLLSFVDLFVLSGFDLAQNRRELIEEGFDFARAGGRYELLELVRNLLRMVNLPFTIYGGLVIGTRVFHTKRHVELVYFLPVISSVFNTVAIGARSGIASALIFFFLGMLIALFSGRGPYVRKLRAQFKYAVALFLIFSIYSTYVNLERSAHGMQGGNYVGRWEAHPSLAPFSGVLQYLTDHLWGYQLRRNDALTPELEYGQTTFACFTTFNVPVVSQIIGEEVSLRNLFNLKDPDPRKVYLALDRKGLGGLGLTATVYFVLYDDFGFYGVFVMVFLFVWYSSRVFERLFIKSQLVSFWSILPFIVVYHLWTKTVFSHHLSGNWLNGFIYPILIIEMVNYFSNVRGQTSRPSQLGVH